MTMVPYVIRQGDYLTRLAARRGFDADEVWNHSKNADLRQLRSNPNMLLPGDVLYVPSDPPSGVSISSGGSHDLKAKVPTVKVELIMKDLDEPMANEAYVVEGLGRPGEPVEGTTDGEGKITLDVPSSVREVRVVFRERGLAIPVLIGDLDPPNDASGIRQRLQHLGHYGWYGGGDDGDENLDQEELDRRAIAAFQAAQGREVTGELDDETRDAIVDVHGS
jgi:hypothetical protein